MNTLSEELRTSLKILPSDPGVYQFLNAKGSIIYIGKAKNLKNRVQSYFFNSKDSFKKKLLVNSIASVKFVVVETESDALLLENNLIKSHQPKYNVLLKDGKTYPWIVIKKEPFPRVLTTRIKHNDGSVYFGPFPNVRHMTLLLNLIKELFYVRSCSLDLSREKIAQKKYAVCLDYHIHKCKGPCEALQSKTEYEEMIEKIKLLLQGKTRSLLKLLNKQMSDYANAQKFEKAEQIKKIILGLEKYRSKSIIVSELQHTDVLSIEESKNVFYFNYMVIKEGAIMNAYNHKITKKLHETPQDVIALCLELLKEKFNSSNQTVITNFKPDYAHPKYELKTPVKGDKKKLLTLSLHNLKHFISNDKKKAALRKTNTHQNRILETIRKEFKLNSTPIHMECFDNSNLQGTDAVSACVVFKHGKPSKKDYRHFNVQSVEGPDDFETMKEVVFRRYKRLISEKQSLPGLIIIDGGKGQLSAANDALNQLGLKNKIAIVGIAKRLEEIFFPGEIHPLYLDKRSESLKLIQFMRNEAHRFGIKHHRNKRSKSALHSDLINIKGIGPNSQTLLFKEFKTIEKIKSASYTELKEAIGGSKAKLIISYYSKD